jgi:hypothetical protein
VAAKGADVRNDALEVTYEGSSPSRSVEQTIRECLLGLEGFLEEVTSCQVVVGSPRGLPDVTSPCRAPYVHSAPADMATSEAVYGAFDAIMRCLQKFTADGTIRRLSPASRNRPEGHR